MSKALILVVAALALAFTSGCSRTALGGAALGAGAAGAAYEYTNKSALDELEEDYRADRVSKEEYLRRKKEIQDKSLLY